MVISHCGTISMVFHLGVSSFTGCIIVLVLFGTHLFLFHFINLCSRSKWYSTASFLKTHILSCFFTPLLLQEAQIEGCTGLYYSQAVNKVYRYQLLYCASYMVSLRTLCFFHQQFDLKYRVPFHNYFKLTTSYQFWNNCYRVQLTDIQA